ncbi:hypothetical protein F441_18174 [Phytophthora nicotianae CJ01A1]|uniref:Uncharacterized protein n=1 Tax=Phytophthora nicotianae CJ01A1 TaxID=1317063 RepID=W2W3N9_PHYNI|nr:hypothetical protein F441_18174 [Phytophthora nicotianae CJ01A1]
MRLQFVEGKYVRRSLDTTPTLCNGLVWHDVGTTVAGEIFQQDRWMIGSDEESSEPNKRVVDTQDRAQRNSEGSQTEKTRGHEEE